VSGLFDRFKDYDFRYWISIQAEAGADESVHRLFAHRGRDLSNSWFGERERRSELSGYVADLDVARSLATRASVKRTAVTVGLQLRYALIAGVIRDLASNLNPPFLARCIQTGVWRREQALTWAKLNPNPQTAIKVVAEELRRDSGHDREELGRLALLIGTSINDSDGRVSAVASLAGDVPGFLLRQTLEIIAKEQNEGSRLGGFRALVPKLPASLALDSFEVARHFTDRNAKIEAIALVAPHLKEPWRSKAYAEFLLEARILLQNTSSHRISVERLANILPAERFEEFGKLIDSETNPQLYEDYLKEKLVRWVERDPIWTYEQASRLSERSANDVFMLVAKILADRRQYAEAAEAGKRVNKSTWEWDRNSETLAEILKGLPESEWPRWNPILNMLSDSPGIEPRIRVLCSLGKTAPDRPFLSRMISQFCREESEELQVLASAAAILGQTEREELLTRALRESNLKLRNNIVCPLVPFLSLAQVRSAVTVVDRIDVFNEEPLLSLLVRLAELEPDEAVEKILNLPEASELDRAKLAAAVATHIPTDKLLILRRAIRPKGIAWPRATAYRALLPWLRDERVGDIIAEICCLDVFHRMRVFCEMITQYPVDRLHHIARTMLKSLEWYVSRPSMYRDDLVNQGFRAISRALALSPSDQITLESIALATREELSGEEQITHLMGLVSAGGPEVHQRIVISVAFRLAIERPELYSSFAVGLSAQHAGVLGILTFEQQKDADFVLLLMAACEFLNTDATEKAVNRIAKISDLRLKFAGLDALLPKLPTPARAAAASRELEQLSRSTVDAELLVPLICLLVRHVPSARKANSERCIDAFMRLDDHGKVANGGLLIETFKPGREVVESIWAAVSGLQEEDQIFAYAGLGPWLETSQIANSLKLLVKLESDDPLVWTALLRRANELNMLRLVKESMDALQNGLIVSHLIERLAAELPLELVESILQQEKALDYSVEKAFRHLGYRAVGALAVRAAELGDMGLALDFMELRKASHESGDTTVERVYELAPKSWSERLVEYSEQLYIRDQPGALAKLIMKVPRKRQRALVELIVDKLSSRASTGTDRMRIMRELEPDLNRLPKSVIASMWSSCLDRSSKLGREETLEDVSCFASTLVHHFGPTAAQMLDEAIRIGGSDHWP
jgi:hypothetical protein